MRHILLPWNNTWTKNMIIFLKEVIFLLDFDLLLHKGWLLVDNDFINAGFMVYWLSTGGHLLLLIVFNFVVWIVLFVIVNTVIKEHWRFVLFLRLIFLFGFLLVYFAFFFNKSLSFAWIIGFENLLLLLLYSS